MEFKRNFANVEVVKKPEPNSGKIMQKFKKQIEEKYGKQFDSYWELHRWTCDYNAEFWAEIWDFLGVISSKKYEQVIDLTIPIDKRPEWFKGARLNYAENLLKYRDDKIAMISAGEDKETEKVTFAEMYRQSSIYAAAFRKFGVKKNDVVVCYMSNRVEAMYAMLAAVSIGALFTGALPLMGPQAVMNRLNQVNPKLMITVDRFPQNGDEINMLPKLEEISKGMPTLEKILIVPSKPNSKSKDISKIRHSCFLDEFLKTGLDVEQRIPKIEFEQVSFSHPVFISFTSGTTGVPKAIVHGFGGLLSIIRDFHIHMDAPRDSVWFSISPVGWASWNMFSSLTFVGHTLVLFESIPFYLTPTYFWDLVDSTGITHLFLQSSVVDEMDKRNFFPSEKNSLKSLQKFLSGGSVVKLQSYDFVYDKVKKDLLFSAAYGCTEVMGSCLIVECTLAVHKGEIPAISMGCDVVTVDDQGRPIEGEMGEIVIRNSMPNLPLQLWGDKDWSFMQEKYFSKYPGTFCLGDYGIINPITKGIIICCRSDDTLKQRGCRFGSSEIYNVVESFPEVRDSLCVSKYDRNMIESAVLFLKMREGHEFSERLVAEVRTAITRELTARHVPDYILQVQDIPYNINAKKLEIIVKKIINRMPYSKDVVVNEDSLKYYEHIPELDHL